MEMFKRFKLYTVEKVSSRRINDTHEKLLLRRVGGGDEQYSEVGDAYKNYQFVGKLQLHLLSK